MNLNLIKNRVRNLIGNSNWAEEGRYKETILKNVIRRFLPAKYISRERIYCKKL